MKMKTQMQISFEFMIYLAISLSSMLIGIAIFLHFHSSVSNISNRIYLEQFATLINENIGFQSSSFMAFVPNAICNKTLLDNIFNASNLNIAANGIVVNKTLCSNNQTIKSVELNILANGSIELK